MPIGILFKPTPPPPSNPPPSNPPSSGGSSGSSSGGSTSGASGASGTQTSGTQQPPAAPPAATPATQTQPAQPAPPPPSASQPPTPAAAARPGATEASAPGTAAAVRTRLAAPPDVEMTASEETIARRAIEAALAEARRAAFVDQVTATAKGWLEAQPGTDLMARPEEAEEVGQKPAADEAPKADPAKAEDDKARLAPREPAASANPLGREPAMAGGGLDRRL